MSDPYSALVRSVLGWSIRVVDEAEARSERFPSPALPRCALGSLLSRSDPQTCEAIAREIVEIQRLDPSDASVQVLVRLIQSSWGSESPGPSRRTGSEDSVIVADRLVCAMRRFGTERDRELLRLCCKLRTWAAVAQVLRGRDPQSVRDDFLTVSRRFWNKEQELVQDTSEYITRLVRSRASSR